MIAPAYTRRHDPSAVPVGDSTARAAVPRQHRNLRCVVIPSPLPWALARIRAGRESQDGQLPRYGSPDWAALPAGSAARWASVVLAAECWRTDGLIAAADLEAERVGGLIDADREADERFAEQARAIRRMANTPTHAELQRRRAEVGTS